MVPLRPTKESDPRHPDFLMPRLVADLQFEPSGPAIIPGATVFDSALLDTGAGYLTIPYRVHKAQHLKIYQEFDPKPYRVLSTKDEPIRQRFAEIGLRFLVKQDDGTRAYWPQSFLKARAYLLDADQRPQAKVLVGLDFLLEHFVTHLEQDNAFLKTRGGA